MGTGHTAGRGDAGDLRFISMAAAKPVIYDLSRYPALPGQPIDRTSVNAEPLGD